MSALGILKMDTEERLKIWQALSDLFLDTEIEDSTFKYIAHTVSESEFSLSEVEDILWYEVYPVLESNLRSVAGVWEGWSELGCFKIYRLRFAPPPYMESLP